MTNIRTILLRASVLFAIGVLLGGCTTLDEGLTNNTMAAKIYTDLSHYYWQQGYAELANDRLNMALQQAPNYPAALALQKRYKNDQSH